MNKEQVLDTAKGLICNDRPKHYGTPKENFSRIAGMWAVILNKQITPEQVALCMCAVKITRLMQTPKHDDSWIDLAGYSACGAEAAAEDEKEPNMWGV